MERLALAASRFWMQYEIQELSHVILMNLCHTDFQVGYFLIASSPPVSPNQASSTRQLAWPVFLIYERCVELQVVSLPLIGMFLPGALALA